MSDIDSDELLEELEKFQAAAAERYEESESPQTAYYTGKELAYGEVTRLVKELASE